MTPKPDVSLMCTPTAATSTAGLWTPSGRSSPYDATTSTNMPHNFIEEIEVKTGGYAAEFGRAHGAIVSEIGGPRMDRPTSRDRRRWNGGRSEMGDWVPVPSLLNPWLRAHN